MPTLHNTAHVPSRQPEATATFDLPLHRIRYLIGVMEKRSGVMSGLQTYGKGKDDSQTTVRGYVQQVMFVIAEVADQGDDSLLTFARH